MLESPDVILSRLTTNRYLKCLLGLFGLEYFVENVQKRIVSTYMNKFQDTGKMFNSEANLNNFLTNNEYMREILSSIENEKGKEKSNVDKDKEKDKDSETRKEKETEKSPDKFYSTDPTLNSLYRELTSIMKVLIKKITDYQALARDCRGSSKGGVGKSNVSIHLSSNR